MSLYTNLACCTHEDDESADFDAKEIWRRWLDQKEFFKHNHSHICCKASKFRQDDIFSSIVAEL